ncbi:hypothetical protein [Salinigranum sp.]|uniref:hypothetical protein n=1 Tax=Salinigranum sp. TaxID=1966351 RepID=UPI003563DFFD
MDSWDHREARALVDAFLRADAVSVDTAGRAYELIDDDQPVRALTLVLSPTP